jgi:hypothetical protein
LLLDIAKWKLHPIELSEKSMTECVLAAASLNFKTASYATLLGILGTISIGRDIYASLVCIVSIDSPTSLRLAPNVF